MCIIFETKLVYWKFNTREDNSLYHKTFNLTLKNNELVMTVKTQTLKISPSKCWCCCSTKLGSTPTEIPASLKLRTVCCSNCKASFISKQSLCSTWRMVLYKPLVLPLLLRCDITWARSDIWLEFKRVFFERHSMNWKKKFQVVKFLLIS